MIKMNDKFNFFDNQEDFNQEPKLFTFPEEIEENSYMDSSQPTISENDNNKKEDDNIKSSSISSHNYNNNKNKKSTHLGRKKKGSIEISKHNKFSYDNLTRKIKALFHKSVFRFLNEKLKENNIILNAIIDNKNYSSKKFLKMERNQNYEILTSFNLGLFDTKIRDYMSGNLSKKCTKYPASFHKEAINRLYKEEEKNKDIIVLLELKYLDCFKYYRGDEDRIKAECLKGLDKYFSEIPEILEKKGNEENYIDKCITLTKEFDSYYKKKKPRQLKVKKKNTNNSTD